MQADALGDSAQSQSAVSAQAASSDDCSAVKLKSTDPAQDGGTSTPHQLAAAMQSPAQHAQQALITDTSQQLTLQHQAAAAPSTSRHLRKRKQPSSEEEQQQHAAPSTSVPVNAAGEENVASKGEQDGLVPVLSRCKGKRKGSKAAGLTEAPEQGIGIRAKGHKSKYDAVVGHTVDVPAPIFGVDIPDLYYRGTVLKKDPAHAGSVVVRFVEDGSRYWFPLADIERFLKDMQSKGRDAESDTIGQGSHAFAAQVLAGTLVAKKMASGITCSSATAGSHEVEVSSGVHQGVSKARSPSRFSKRAPTDNPDEETSSLQALAAAADSGEI